VTTVDAVRDFPTLWQVATVVGFGVLPIAEGNVAVPVGLALGMSPVLAVLLSVLGTTSQTLFVRGAASWVLSFPRIARWWERRWTGRTRQLFEWRGVTWVILIGIPWLGGVPTALGAQLAGIRFARYARWAIGGLLLHAATLALLIRLGLRAAGKR
jgi:uncharacterized membrane protein